MRSIGLFLWGGGEGRRAYSKNLQRETDKAMSLPTGQGCADGGVGERHAPNILEFARKLVESQSCCKRVGQGIFCDLLFVFLVTIAGQMIKRPSPSPREGGLGTSLRQRCEFTDRSAFFASVSYFYGVF